MSKVTKQKMLSQTAAELAMRPQPYALWRTLPAELFDEVRRIEVMCHVDLFMTNIKEWRDAITGDAAAAVGIALRMTIPDEITYPVDARMTLLVYTALNGSAGAALVVAHILRQMPIEQELRSQLTASWLTRNLLIGYSELPSTGRLRRRRSIAYQLLNGEERAS
ncbi:MAG TPA: hypothetical protein VI256_19300 [Roseiarcus sp.]